MKKTLIAVVATAAVVGLSGCANQTTRDLENIHIQEPDSTRLYANVDKYPNIVVNCIDGVAFVTTTRDYDGITRVPELDATC